MDFINQIARQVVGLPEATDWSVACIATTNPVYLLFSRTSDSPDYVVRVTPSSQNCTHNIGVVLHKAAGDLVPEPLGLIHQDGKLFSVQRGVAGMPWFQIAHRYAGADRWQALRATATETLNTFHQRISRGLPSERLLIRPSQELRSAYQVFLQIHQSKPDGLEAKVDKYESALASLGEITGVPQHGDFSLNNLIIREEPEQVTVIDFEDFNLTQMPLYDEFTLALSFYTSAPGSWKPELSEELQSCIERSAVGSGYDRQIIEGLFLFHLLSRLGPWSLGIKRQPYRQWLLTLLEQFTRNPKDFFPD